ncbi:YeeE/YedE family protein [Defluviimonas sp. SAOS-178_SWC]|uniref:YeeE/YedE family protein n=1 Tax=Defluviimonas sp. SAOS-178_SWC TaxID=3121287 RepID=UPI003221E84E
MLRNVFAALSGGLFGLGLVVSDMTNTLKVQGWLDVFGAWDPTLAFVLGGAVMPMAVAWVFAARRDRSVLGTPFPALPKPVAEPDIVIGSLLFGMGWGLSGLCPGPSMAVLGFGGWQGVVFLLSMIAGMVATPAIRGWMSRPVAA